MSDLAEARERLLRVLQLEGIHDARVLQAIRDTPRHELVPPTERPHAYENRPLPIGDGQTISQPYIVALMTALAEIQPEDRVLEVGTGSGYQTAILAALAAEVFTVEVIGALAERARSDLTRLGLAKSVHFRLGDGYTGWPEAAPFSAILVTAAPPEVPQPLLTQLAQGGHLVIPIGECSQELLVIEKTAQGYRRRPAIPVRFVPMTGRAQRDG